MDYYRKNRFFWIFIVIMFIVVQVVSASDWYVSPSGSGTTCSIGSPCSFVYAVQTKAFAGDNVYVATGNYNNVVLVLPRSGTSSQPISIIGDVSPSRPYMDGGWTTNSNGRQALFDLNGKSYITIKNFNGTHYNNILVSENYPDVHNIWVENVQGRTGGETFWLQNYVSYSTLKNVKSTGSGSANAISIAGTFGQEGVEGQYTHDIMIDGAYVENAGHSAIDFYDCLGPDTGQCGNNGTQILGTMRNLTVINSTVYGKTVFGHDKEKFRNVTIKNNVIAYNPTSGTGQFKGIQMRIINSNIYCNSVHDIYNSYAINSEEGGASNNVIYGNYIYNSAVGVSILGSNIYSKNKIVNNQVDYKADGGDMKISNAIGSSYKVQVVSGSTATVNYTDGRTFSVGGQSGLTTKTFTVVGTYTIVASSEGSLPTDCTIAVSNPSPQIISWNNNKTSNSTTSLTLNISESVQYSASADQTITMWTWKKDGVDQNNNINTFTTSFGTTGSHVLSVYGTNGNGTSNTITWTVTIPVEPSSQSIIGEGGLPFEGNTIYNNTIMDIGNNRLTTGLFADNFNGNNDTWINQGDTWLMTNGKKVQSNSLSPWVFTHPISNIYTNVTLISIVNITERTTGNKTGHALRSDDVNKEYELFYNNSQAVIQLWTSSGGYVTLNSTSQSLPVLNTDYYFKSQSVGNNLRFKYWQVGTSEPNWMVTALNSSIASGFFELSVAKSTINIDNVTEFQTDLNGNSITFGNATISYDAGSGNQTSNITINSSTPIGTNYTFSYREHNIGSYVQIGDVSTGNNTFSLPTKYQYTDINLYLQGNETVKPEIINVNFKGLISGNDTQPPSPPMVSYQYIINSTNWFGIYNNVTENLGSHGIDVGNFTDNFDDNNEAWNETNGTWSVSNGKYVQSQYFADVSNNNFTSPNNINYSNITTIFTLNISNRDLPTNLVGNLLRRNGNYRYEVYYYMSSSPTIMEIDYDNPYPSYVTLNTTTQSNITKNITYYFKSQSNGNILRAKYWQVNTSEPDWMITATNSSLSNGTVTIYFYRTAFSVDNFRILNVDSNGNSLVSGNFTTWYNAGVNNVTKQITVNASVPSGTNFTILYAQNGTNNFSQIGGIYTSNTTVIVPVEYQNTDVKIILNGNETITPEISSITYIWGLPSTFNSIPTIDWLTPPTPTNGSSVLVSQVILGTNTTDTENDRTTEFINFDNTTLAWWQFNNNVSIGENSSYFVDKINGYNATCTSCPSIVSQIFDNGLSFNGNTSLLTVSNFPKTPNKLTIEWFGKINTPTRQSIIERWAYNYTNSINNRSFEVDIDNGFPKFGVSLDGTSNTFWTTSNISVTYGEPTYVVWTTDGEYSYIYVNKKLGIKQYLPFSTIYNISTPIHIGGWMYDATTGVTDTMMAGETDWLRIHNRTFTFSDVNNSYNHTLQQENVTFHHLENRTYNYTAYVEDTSGNVNQTAIQFFTVLNVSTFMPPTPINLTLISNGWSGDGYLQNIMWEAGVGNVTDSYYIKENDGWVKNQTTQTTYSNFVSPHSNNSWKIYSYNQSAPGIMNQTPTIIYAEIQNNAPILDAIGNKNVTIGGCLYLNLTAVDDPQEWSMLWNVSDSNFTLDGQNYNGGGATNYTASYSYCPTSGNSHNVTFTVNDTYGGIDSEQIILGINQINNVSQSLTVSDKINISKTSPSINNKTLSESIFILNKVGISKVASSVSYNKSVSQSLIVSNKVNTSKVIATTLKNINVSQNIFILNKVVISKVANPIFSNGNVSQKVSFGNLVNINKAVYSVNNSRNISQQIVLSLSLGISKNVLITPTPTPTSTIDNSVGIGVGGKSSNTAISETTDINILKDAVTTTSFSNNGIIDSLTLKGIYNYGYGKITVNVLKNSPVESNFNNTYKKFISITLDSMSQNEERFYFTDTSFNIKLPKEDVGNKQVNIYRYYDNDWKLLDISKIGEDDIYYYYKVSTFGYSYFAIVLSDTTDLLEHTNTIIEEINKAINKNEIVDKAKEIFRTSTNDNKAQSFLLSVIIILSGVILFMLGGIIRRYK